MPTGGAERRWSLAMDGNVGSSEDREHINVHVPGCVDDRMSLSSIMSTALRVEKNLRRSRRRGVTAHGRLDCHRTSVQPM